MTPNAIEILIHCYVCPLPHPRSNSPAVAEELRSLKASELIEEEPGSEGGYRTTERGRAHIIQLCNLEYPIQAWISSDGKQIEMNIQ